MSSPGSREVRFSSAETAPETPQCGMEGCLLVDLMSASRQTYQNGSGVIILDTRKSSTDIKLNRLHLRLYGERALRQHDLISLSLLISLSEDFQQKELTRFG
jgi:hypothetical protein